LLHVPPSSAIAKPASTASASGTKMRAFIVEGCPGADLTMKDSL
jgi:hypothetical protein